MLAETSVNSDIIIFVFSFNRGRFLQNCIQSIEKCAPEMEVIIIDDGSDDKATQKVLIDLGKRYEIIKNATEHTEKKTGGLYGNMSLAMDMARKRQSEYVLFIQDDMQLVRPILDTDLKLIQNYFSSNKNTMQYVTCFIGKLSGENYLERNFIDESKTSYITKKEFEKGKTNFAATGIFSVSRFFELFKKFEVGEYNNSIKARELNLVIGRAIYPFMCWLPYPPSFRDKGKGIKHRFFEYFAKVGFYPIQYMNDKEVDNLLSRDPGQLPIMDDFLTSPSCPHKNWSAGGGEYVFLAANSTVAKLYKLVRRVKNIFLS